MRKPLESNSKPVLARAAHCHRSRFMRFVVLPRTVCDHVATGDKANAVSSCSFTHLPLSRHRPGARHFDGTQILETQAWALCLVPAPGAQVRSPGHKTTSAGIRPWCSQSTAPEAQGRVDWFGKGFPIAVLKNVALECLRVICSRKVFESKQF